MNVGQILETHLGAASVDLGKKFLNLALGAKHDKSNIIKIKNLFKSVYGEEIFNDRFDKLKQDSEIIQRAITFKSGVPFATPVFDGAKEWILINFLMLLQVIQVVSKD